MNQNIFSKGDKVQISTKKEGIVKGKFSHLTPSGVAYIHGDNGKAYERVLDKVVKLSNADTNFEVSDVKGHNAQPKSGKVFNINKRFDFLESLVRMTIKGKRVSLIITGEGGLGKTYTVKKGLEQMKLDNSQYHIIKGFSTAKGLYKTLYEHNGKLIIFDDCDEVLKNDTAKNILKGALDSYDERIVHWITSKESSEELPDNFVFEGRIIFISNMSKYRIDQAILSRASNVDVSMSIEDKLTRMEYIVKSPAFAPKATKEEVMDGFNLLKKHAENCANLTLRTLIEIIDYRTSGEDNWEELAEYVIYSS